jgi:peptidoglycan-associated lipoprotein
MRKRMMTGMIALAFFCSALLLLTACGKKQVAVSPTTDIAAEEAARKSAEEAKLRAEAEAKARAKEEAKDRAEAERAQMLAEFDSGNIYFEFDESTLGPEAQAVLKKKADVLRANPSFSSEITGHCDERGTNEYNLALGERRARSAKKFLMALGISGDRIKTISYGEEKPADTRSNEEAWAKNRRDEFTLIK